MSSEPPVSTWKCNTCGTANRFANPTCVLCNGPRPADIAMPSGGQASQLGGTPPPTQFGGAPEPPAGERPFMAPMGEGQAPRPPAGGRPPMAQMGEGQPPSPYGGQRPAAYPGQFGRAPVVQTAQSMPAGLIVLCVLEGLGVLSALWGIISGAMMASKPMPMPTGSSPMPFNPMALGGGVNIFMNLIALALAGFALYGFIRRLNAARIVAMVQASLNALFGVLAAVGGLLMFLASSAARSSSARMGIPSAPGVPANPAAAMGMVGGVMLAVGGVVLIVSILIIWYLTSEKVKSWLSD